LLVLRLGVIVIKRQCCFLDRGTLCKRQRASASWKSA